jgi:RNA polymerase sigma-70 factor (ECF subfamily)
MSGRRMSSTEVLAWPVSSAVPRGSMQQDTPHATSDAQLIEALRSGEGWAALQLYERLLDTVTRTLSRLLRHQPHALEDLVQTTFERMIRFLTANTLDARCNLRGWASTVASNVAIDYLRRELSERRLFVSADAHHEAAGANGSPEAALDSRASLRKLQRLIAAMDPKYAQTVILHDVLGHELSEIALLMDVSVAAAQSRLVRGRKELLRRAGQGRVS